MQLSDNTKKLATTIAGLAFAIAIGVQTFLFGKNDMQTLTEKVDQLSQRIELLEQRSR
jgi:polyhydroxyalkanoate synthesis regulator phasin